jgi:putative membrane protein
VKSLHLEKKEIILIAILVIFHTVGVFTMFSENWRSIVLPLSAFNLLLAISVLVLSFKNEISKVLIFIAICFIAGMTFEWIGIHTGLLFGDYHYGKNLGIKLFDVPLIIGVNWGILVISSGMISQLISKNIIVRTILTSLLMTILDFLIEPVAMSSDYWSWANDTIPIFNYVCWFVLSLPLSFLFVKFNFREQNKVAIGLYLIFVCFFSILNFY